MKICNKIEQNSHREHVKVLKIGILYLWLIMVHFSACTTNIQGYNNNILKCMGLDEIEV